MKPLRFLAAAMEGKLPPEDAWERVIEIANKGWMGPALYVSLERHGALDRIPAEVRDYLLLLHDLNRERNRRLREQLLEAVRALNSASVEPILLKGCVRLFGTPGQDFAARMLSDIDLNIEASELPRARAALLALGYVSTSTDRQLGRPEDAGMLELHLQPSARSAGYLSGDLRDLSRRVEELGAVALVPSPVARAVHLIVHDMIKDGDYWRLRVDLRHLDDLAALARSPEGLDWQELQAALPQGTGRAALQLQARALHELFGVALPSELLGGPKIALKHRVRMMVSDQRPGSAPLRALANMRWGLHRLHDGYRWKGMPQFYRSAHRLFLKRKASKL